MIHELLQVLVTLLLVWCINRLDKRVRRIEDAVLILAREVDTLNRAARRRAGG